MKFSQKISYSSWISLGLILCSISMYVFHSNYNMRMDRVKGELKRLALQESDEIDRLFYERFVDIGNIAADSVISSREATAHDIAERLTFFRNNAKTYSSLSFFDLNYATIADTSGLGIGKKAKDDQVRFLKDAIADREYVTNVEMEDSIGQVVIRFLHSVKDKDGRTFGVVMSSVPIGVVMETIFFGQEIDMIPDNDVYVLDRNGMIIMSTDRESKVSRDNLADMLSGAEAVFQDKCGSGVFYDRRSGENCIVGFARGEGYSDYAGSGWITLFKISQKKALLPVVRLRGQLIFFSALILLITLPTILITTDRFLRPLAELNIKLAALGAGDLSARMKTISKDELGEVARSFNSMAEQLAHKTTSIDALSKEVAERKKLDRALIVAKEQLERQNKVLESQLKESDRSREIMVSMLEDNNDTRARLEKSLEELKKAQSIMIQSEKLEAIGRLASGVAHETRNPLGIILQGVNYLERRIPPEAKDSLDTLQIIKGSVSRADKILRALSDLSRVSDVIMKSEDANVLIESSLLLVQYAIKLENIKVVKELQDAIPPISVDKGKIEQVFINMLTNAIQAMSGGGTLTLRSYLARLNKLEGREAAGGGSLFEPDEDVVVVEIEDTGGGISDDNIKKLFEPFFTTKEPGKGTGLGLSVSRNIMEMHKGLIWITSQFAKGTKVTVVFKMSGKS